MPAMAVDKAAPALMDLPLEVRHTVFKYVAARDAKPKKLLRYWFEKQEVKALVEQEAANNPNGPMPRVVYGNDYDDDDSDDESTMADDDGVDSDDNDNDNENADEDSENEDGDSNDDDEDQDEHEDAEQEEDDEGQEEAEIYGADVDEASEEAVDGAQTFQQATAQATAQVNLDNQPTDAQDDADQGHIQGDEQGDDTEDVQPNAGEEGENDSESEDDEELADGHGNTGAAVAVTQPPPVPVVVRPHTKWRHIPYFMRLTKCPPPAQLLLASRQLNNEAKNWFYNVATLHIDATGSFAHTSFFEEAFSQITDAAFSPMENIRKVDVTFVWDSTWIRADTTDCVGAIFPALLRQRSSFVYQILSQAPDLREVIIHWHDSAQDDESTNLMLDNLAPFHTLPATVKVIEHYIAADATPRKRSVAGKRRVEFQNILDMGLDRLL